MTLTYEVLNPTVRADESFKALSDSMFSGVSNMAGQVTEGPKSSKHNHGIMLH